MGQPTSHHDQADHGSTHACRLPWPPCRRSCGAYLTMATDEARVLTIRQPWAWAVIHGGKDVENRSWPTKHRGPLLIHAGRAFEFDEYETVKRLAAQPPPPAREFTHGAIIGVVELVDCLQGSHSEWAVNGQWHWCLRNPQPFDQAVPCPGKLGLWRPPRGVTW
jgi:hypothetical protein